MEERATRLSSFLCVRRPRDVSRWIKSRRIHQAIILSAGDKKAFEASEWARDELQPEPLVHSQQQRLTSHTNTICAFGNPTTRISGQISQAKSECIGPRYKIEARTLKSHVPACVWSPMVGSHDAAQRSREIGQPPISLLALFG